MRHWSYRLASVGCSAFDDCATRSLGDASAKRSSTAASAIPLRLQECELLPSASCTALSLMSTLLTIEGGLLSAQLTCSQINQNFAFDRLIIAAFEPADERQSPLLF